MEKVSALQFKNWADINSSSRKTKKQYSARTTDTFLKHTKWQSDALRTAVSISVVTQKVYFWIPVNLSKQQDGGLDACISKWLWDVRCTEEQPLFGVITSQFHSIIHYYAYYGPVLCQKDTRPPSNKSCHWNQLY